MDSFADVQYCIYAGWVRKSPKYADIIQGWFLSRLLNSKVIIGNLDICLLSSNLHCVEAFSKVKLLKVVFNLKVFNKLSMMSE